MRSMVDFSCVIQNMTSLLSHHATKVGLVLSADKRDYVHTITDTCIYNMWKWDNYGTVEIIVEGWVVYFLQHDVGVDRYNGHDIS